MAVSDDELVAAATQARENAFAPYSGFRVGAAVETADGNIFAGCNVESASYGGTACAERVAIWSAVAAGNKKIVKIAVVTDASQLTPPCGICRQIIWEFGGDITVILANTVGEREKLSMAELLPRAFDASLLPSD